MNKKITTSLDGKEIVLNYGVNRFYHLFKEGTGHDLFTFGEGFDISKLVLFAQGFVYAGYYSECKLNKTEPEFTKEQIFEMVMDADSSMPNDLFKKYNESMSEGEANGQLKESLLTN
jgi:hypothetical protein